MIRKRSVSINGHYSAVSAEDLFWKQLGLIAKRRNMSINALVTEIDAKCSDKVNLSSEIRVFVLQDTLNELARVTQGDVSENQPVNNVDNTTPVGYVAHGE